MVPTGNHEYLDVSLPKKSTFIWIAIVCRTVWIQLGISILGKWLASALEVLTASLIAETILGLGGDGKASLAIPGIINEFIYSFHNPVVSAIILAIMLILTTRLVETAVEWCLPWIHMVVNKKVTPEIIHTIISGDKGNFIDPSTAVQRWLLKLDLSYFIHESIASTLGNVGTIVIIWTATLAANKLAAQTCGVMVVTWTITAVPLIIKTLRASRRIALAHEDVGRILRESAILRHELYRPKLYYYWSHKNKSQLIELENSIKVQGQWNSAMFAILGLLARLIPIIAVLAAAISGSLQSALAIMLYLSKISTPLWSLAGTLPRIQQNLISITRLFEFLLCNTNKRPATKTSLVVDRLIISDWIITLRRNLTLKLPETKLESGSILLITGPSGIGKSSLLYSLAGHMPSQGKIIVNDIPVDILDSAWRNTCQLVRQEPELIPGSISDNLSGFPNWTNSLAKEKVLQYLAISISNASFETVSVSERRLSVGQRRAIAVLQGLGSDAQVIFLDEPIAGMDQALQALVIEAIEEAAANGKVIVVTGHEHELQLFRFRQHEHLRLESKLIQVETKAA